MIRRLLAAVVTVALAGCTPDQTTAWWAWHRADPQAAEAFVNTPAGRAMVAADPPAPRSGDCASFAGLFARNGLPVSEFTFIAHRESGCNSNSFVDTRSDLGGGLLGLNLRSSGLRRTWFAWCGLTTGNVTNAEVNVRCAGVAYRKMGLAPWR